MWFVLAALAHPLDAPGLAETRVVSAPAPLPRGIAPAHLADRLDQLGYTRIHGTDVAEGEYFWGSSRFVLHRRAYRYDGVHHGARLLDLPVVSGRLDPPPRVRLDPLLLGEDLDGTRAAKTRVTLADLPDHAWLPLLALEDSRFFRHAGIDAVGIVRATVANVRAGRVVQGGSTLTQQLVKNRRLSPERTASRKAREAAHALLVDALYAKDPILESYLDTVYFGHVDGLGIYGLGTASRVYFSREASELTLDQAATLAAMVQAPNALSPIDHPDAARARRNLALRRMAKLGWISSDEADAVAARPLGVRKTAPRPTLAVDLRRTLDPSRAGVRVETSLDPWLQQRAEAALSSAPAGTRASLISVDATSGEVLAWAGSNPLRQPGSSVKPFVVLAAFEDCGLGPSSRVDDGPLSVDLEDGSSWSPRNADGRNRGAISVREALVDSRNRPLVRISERCGRDRVATELASVGLPVGDHPASLPLGSVEVTPLQLAGGYAVFASGGSAWDPVAVTRVETPHGRRLERTRPTRRRASNAVDTWLVRDVLEDAMTEGTGRRGRVAGGFAKTGTSSGGRDAWLAGGVGDVVTVVWVGRDDGGLSGGRTAAPIWQEYMQHAREARPPASSDRPSAVRSGYVDASTGLRVGRDHPRATPELWRRGRAPRRDWLLRADEPSEVLR